MALTNSQLDDIVTEWNGYVSSFLESMDVVRLLRQKNLSMYMALGAEFPESLAQRLISDYVSSSIENTMGHLYELVFAELGPVKVPNEKKHEPGYIGLDFTQDTPSEVRLIDLAAASNTKNGGARIKSKQDLERAAIYWERVVAQETNDNPMAKKNKQVVRVWAVARGTPSKSISGEILKLRGDALWEYFGAGEGCLARIGAALARNPVTGSAFHGALEAAQDRLVKYLQVQGFIVQSGELSWPQLLATYP